MLRLIFALILAVSPLHAAPGAEAAADMRCAALLSRVGDALDAAGHRTTLQTVRGMQAAFLNLAASRETAAGTGFMGELARTPPVTLPADRATLAELEGCARRLPP